MHLRPLVTLAVHLAVQPSLVLLLSSPLPSGITDLPKSDRIFITIIRVAWSFYGVCVFLLFLDAPGVITSFEQFEYYKRLRGSPSESYTGREALYQITSSQAELKLAEEFLVILSDIRQLLFDVCASSYLEGQFKALVEDLEKPRDDISGHTPTDYANGQAPREDLGHLREILCKIVSVPDAEIPGPVPAPLPSRSQYDPLKAIVVVDIEERIQGLERAAKGRVLAAEERLLDAQRKLLTGTVLDPEWRISFPILLSGLCLLVFYFYFVTFYSFYGL